MNLYLAAQDPTLADFGKDPWWLVLGKIVFAFAFGLLATLLGRGGVPGGGRVILEDPIERDLHGQQDSARASPAASRT